MAEARAYAKLVERPLLSAADVSATSGLARPKVYEALRLLTQRGFAEAVAGDGLTLYRPVPPREALPRWLVHRETERLMSAEQDGNLSATLIEMLPEPDSAPASRDGLRDYFESVEGRTRTNEALAKLMSGARRSVHHMTSPPFLQPQARWNIEEVAAVERGIELRTILTPEAAEVEQRWKALVNAGAEVRVSKKIPMKLIIADGAEAMVSLRHPSSGEIAPNSIIIRHPDLVAPLDALFEKTWSKAKPVQAKA